MTNPHDWRVHPCNSEIVYCARCCRVKNETTEGTECPVKEK